MLPPFTRGVQVPVLGTEMSGEGGALDWVFCSMCNNTNMVGAEMYSAGPFLSLTGSVFELKMNLKTH